MDSDSPLDFFIYPESEQTTVDLLMVVESEGVGVIVESTTQFYYNALSREILFSKSLNLLPLSDYIGEEAARIFYYDLEGKYWVYAGVYPFEKDVFLRAEDFQGEIRIRCRPVVTEYQEIFAVAEYVDQDDGPKADPTKKRIKQRTISDVLYKVSEWRQISEVKKCTLEAAAKLIGLSKKTLDDYYSQIKLGESYNFDFEKHEGDGIGVLRKFVKEKKDKKKPVLKILEKYTGYKKEDLSESEEE